MSTNKFKQKPKQVKAERVKKEPNLRFRGFLASLFKNKAAYDHGRKEKWWVATLLFIFSIIIAIIPAMVMVSKTNGSDNLKGSLYHTDIALTKFVETLDTNNVDLKVIEEASGKKVFSDNGTGFTTTVGTKIYTLTSDSVTSDIPYYSYSEVKTIATRDENDVVTYTDVNFEYLRVYYTAHLDTTYLNGNVITEPEVFLANRLLNLTGEDAKNNVTSHLIIGKTALYMRLYNPNKLSEPNSALTFDGRTNSLEVGLNIRNFGKVDVDGKPILKTDMDYADKVVANFAKMQDAAYTEVKTQRFWISTGMYAIIFTGIGLVMGLVIFVATRGKMNPNRDLKFFEAMKVGAWLLPTPALLTLILGFILPESFFQTIFVMALGMRSVWLTMRTLGPQAQDNR